MGPVCSIEIKRKISYLLFLGSCCQPAASSSEALPRCRCDDRRISCSRLQERKFEGGSGQISECMAKELGELVKMNSPVYRIDQSGDLVVVETLDKKTYKVSVQGDDKEATTL